MNTNVWYNGFSLRH